MKPKMNTVPMVLFFVALFLNARTGIAGFARMTSDAPHHQSELSVETVDELMKEKSIENCQRAIKGYERLLRASPDNLELLVKLSDAYITIIDIKTHALIEEKDEYKPILSKYGKTAYDYAEKALKIDPDCKEAVAAALVSYGYYSSSFGIVKAIFKGSAGHYKDLANRLIEIDDTYESALGYRSLGKLYEVAPWPVGSSRKALKYFKKAVATDPSSLYSHYYLGLLYFKKDKFDLAKKEFGMVVNNPAPVSEAYFIREYKERARGYLSKMQRISG